jgi:hypothetical protein
VSVERVVRFYWTGAPWDKVAKGEVPAGTTEVAGVRMFETAELAREFGPDSGSDQ